MAREFHAKGGDKVLHEWVHDATAWRLTVVNGIVRVEELVRDNWYLADPQYAADALLTGFRQMVGNHGVKAEDTPMPSNWKADESGAYQSPIVFGANGVANLSVKACAGKRVMVWLRIIGEAPIENQKGFRCTAPASQPGYKHKAPPQKKKEVETKRMPWGIERAAE
jgi:hypothetical protein